MTFKETYLSNPENFKKFIEYQLSFGMEGMPDLNKEEIIKPMMKIEKLIILGDYDDVRPSTVFFEDINGDQSKGYLGWRTQC